MRRISDHILPFSVILWPLVNKITWKVRNRFWGNFDNGPGNRLFKFLWCSGFQRDSRVWSSKGHRLGWKPRGIDQKAIYVIIPIQDIQFRVSESRNYWKILYHSMAVMCPLRALLQFNESHKILKFHFSAAYRRLLSLICCMFCNFSYLWY